MQLHPYEVSELLEIEEQRVRLATAIANSKGPNGTLVGEEYCNTCGHYMGYSINTPTDHPVRITAGAIYRDGVGQTCGPCFEKESVLDDAGQTFGSCFDEEF